LKFNGVHFLFSAILNAVHCEFLAVPDAFPVLGAFAATSIPIHELDLKTCDQNMILSLEQCIPMTRGCLALASLPLRCDQNLNVTYR